LISGKESTKKGMCRNVKCNQSLFTGSITVARGQTQLTRAIVYVWRTHEK